MMIVQQYSKTVFVFQHKLYSGGNVLVASFRETLISFIK